MSDQTKAAIHLNADEAAALAMLLTARHLEQDEWLDWGDVPMLSEDSLALVMDAITDLSRDLDRRLRNYELDHDIDARLLHERSDP